MPVATMPGAMSPAAPPLAMALPGGPTPLPAATQAMLQALRYNPSRKLAFFAAMVILWMKFGLVHEYITFKIGIDLRLFLVVSLFALSLFMISGTFKRAYEISLSRWWTVFGAWLLLAVPFSHWIGGSLTFIFKTYLSSAFALYFLMVALPVDLKDIRKLMIAAGCGALSLSLIARSFSAVALGGRMEMEFGSIKNSGDFAAFLMITLPLLLFLWLEVKNWLVRLVVIVAAGSNIWLVLSTATRSALVAFGVLALVVLIWGSAASRASLIVSATLVFLFANLFLPVSVAKRLSTLWGGGESDFETREAEGSTEARKAVMERALKYSFQRPIFGVGPGVFKDYDAKVTKATGVRAQWEETHNAFLQISSEAGLPAALLMIGSILAIFGRLAKLLRQARKLPAHLPAGRMVRSTAFTLMMAISLSVSFMMFLSHGYMFWIPVLLGLSVGLMLVVKYEPTLQPAQAPAHQ